MSDERMKATQRLAGVLEQENEALKRLDFPAAVALLPAKEAALTELAKSPVGSLRQTSLALRISALAVENQGLLERAIAVQTRIVRIVARAYAPPPATTPYNGRGNRQGYGARAPAPRADALAVSTRA
jgi:hypothetical protein